MKQITPHLWFDTEAKEAADIYTALFPNSRITSSTTISGVPTPSGNCDVVSFELSGQPFMAINAGPSSGLNPSISFIVNFDPARDGRARENLDLLWSAFTDGGKVLMPLGSYPFSERYGWIQDRYGISWQLNLASPGVGERPAIVPSLLFTGDVAGRAEEAVEFYMSVFADSRRGIVARYGEGQEPDRAETLMYTDFTLQGQWLAAMDSAREHAFGFNEAISLLIPCESQEEVDYYWDKLAADPEAGQCGWLKDRFGLSWQVWPTAMGEMMTQGTPAQVERVIMAFLQMGKFDIATLRRAFEGKE